MRGNLVTSSWRPLLLAVGVFVLIAGHPYAQQSPVQAGAATPAGQGGEQVGVPGGGEGRGRGAGPTPNPGQGGPPGGRRGRGPAAPAPRGVTGRVLLQGATPSQKGVWLPDG